MSLRVFGDARRQDHALRLVQLEVFQLLQDRLVLVAVNPADRRSEVLQTCIVVETILELLAFLIQIVPLAAELVGGDTGKRPVQAVDAALDDLLVVPVALFR